jgi:VWFA-related protein
VSRRLVGLICAATAALAVPQAQQLPVPQPPPYAERVDVSSIVIDARVIDKFGAPILGLAASDFFVAIGGKPVKVQSSLWTGNVAVAGIAQHPALAAHRTEIADEPGQLVILLFQKSLTRDRARGLIRMVEQSRALVRDLPGSARVAILLFENSLRVWSDFTTDRAALDRILAHGLLHEQPPASVPPGTPSLVKGLTPEPRRIGTIEGAFASIATALQPLPGSKAIAFIGYGMGQVAFGPRQDLGKTQAAFGTQAQDLASGGAANQHYADARRTLTAARVSVFSLDITNADTHTLAQGMQTIAADTGGFYASSLDFPERPMRLVGGALNGHYVLFVEPPAAEPADRTITVGVSASRRANVFSTSSYRSADKF